MSKMIDSEMIKAELTHWGVNGRIDEDCLQELALFIESYSVDAVSFEDILNDKADWKEEFKNLMISKIIQKISSDLTDYFIESRERVKKMHETNDWK